MKLYQLINDHAILIKLSWWRTLFFATFFSLSLFIHRIYTSFPPIQGQSKMFAYQKKNLFYWKCHKLYNNVNGKNNQWGKKGTLKPINENLINYTKERFSIPGDNYLIRSFRHFYEHGYNFVLSSKHVNPIFIKKRGKMCVLHWPSLTYYIVQQYRKSALIAAKFLCSRNAIEYNKYQVTNVIIYIK